MDSNHRPSPSQGGILSSERTRLAPAAGYDPAVSTFEAWRVIHLHYAGVWGTDSPQPSLMWSVCTRLKGTYYRSELPDSNRSRLLGRQ